jgi:hypothetical protein
VINICIPILVADDTSIFFSHSNPDDFVENIHTVFETLNNWFKRNIISLNLEKHYIHFLTKNTSSTFMQISEKNKKIPNIIYAKFLDLIIDNTLSWKNPIDQLNKANQAACLKLRL